MDSPEAAAKPAPDWERIEADYRGGILSLREIAAPFEITEGAIRKRAKAKGWSRDLGAKIRARTEELVRKEAVRAEGTQTDYCVPEAQVIEGNARVALAVVKRHNGISARALTLVEKLFGELELTTDNLADFEQLGALLCKDETTDSGRVIEDKLNKIYHAVISTGGRVDSLKKLAETFEKLAKFERAAYRLEDEAPQPPDGAASLTPERMTEGVRRFAFLLARAGSQPEST